MPGVENRYRQRGRGSPVQRDSKREISKSKEGGKPDSKTMAESGTNEGGEGPENGTEPIRKRKKAVRLVLFNGRKRSIFMEGSNEASQHK